MFPYCIASAGRPVWAFDCISWCVPYGFAVIRASCLPSGEFIAGSCGCNVRDAVSGSRIEGYCKTFFCIAAYRSAVAVKGYGVLIRCGICSKRDILRRNGKFVLLGWFGKGSCPAAPCVAGLFRCSYCYVRSVIVCSGSWDGWDACAFFQREGVSVYFPLCIEINVGGHDRSAADSMGGSLAVSLGIPPGKGVACPCKAVLCNGGFGVVVYGLWRCGAARVLVAVVCKSICVPYMVHIGGICLWYGPRSLVRMVIVAVVKRDIICMWCRTECAAIVCRIGFALLEDTVPVKVQCLREFFLCVIDIGWACTGYGPCWCADT